MDDQNSRQEINKYRKFRKVDGAAYRKVNTFLRKRTYITAREWALARLCTDFRTSGGAEMTFIGQHLPELVPFMEDTYSPQAVNQARNAFKKKVRKSSATFFYGAMCGFFTTDELDDLLFEASEVARFLLEVEGTTLDIDEEIDIEDRITKVMRGVGEAAKTLLKNRAEDEAVSALPKSADLSAIISDPGIPAQDLPHAPADVAIPDNRITASLPDPEQPEPVPVTIAIPATQPAIPDDPPVTAAEPEIPENLPLPGEKQKSPGTREITAEEPVPAVEDIPDKTMETSTPGPGATSPEKEEP
ncbi:MAG: DUF5806 family protein [Methanoregula sp.]|jgi:hypothetical protein